MTKTQKYVSVPVLGAILLVSGAVAGSAGLAFAQSDTTTTTGATSAPSGVLQQIDRHLGGHIGKNGVKEELLTGETLARVTAAAQATQPGATIDRAETDAEGATYEAHMTKADGSHITLKFDANYAVTATEDGPNGHGGPGGQ